MRRLQGRHTPHAHTTHHSPQPQEELGEEATFGEIGQELGARWKELTDEDKAPYTKVGCV